MKLTKPQQQIYDMEKYVGSSVSIICGSMLIEGDCADRNLLISAVNEIFRINDSLRIRISENNGQTIQTVKDYVAKEIKTLLFSTEEELNSYGNHYAKEPLSIYGDLCEISVLLLPHHYGLLIKMHHAVGDAWTLSLLCSQFVNIINGNTPLAYSYSDFVAKEDVYLTSKRYTKDGNYFVDQFENNDDIQYLEARNYSSLKSERTVYKINKDNTRQIFDCSIKNETSVFTIFFTALSVLLSRLNMNMEKFYIGTAVLNREQHVEKNTAGMFVNTVPVLVNLDYNSSFVDNLGFVEDSLFSTFRHSKFNYSDILSEIRSKFGFAEKLYDVILSYQNAVIDCEDKKIKTTWYHSGISTESLEIHIDDRDDSGELRISYDYHIEKYSAKEIERFHSYLMNIISQMVSNPIVSINTLEIMPWQEKEKVLINFNDTRGEYPIKCVHQLFEEQVGKTPDAVALVFEEKSISYKQLDRMSNSLAHYLRKIGVGKNDIIPIISQRSYHLIVAILGILKAGAAYIPVDYSYPIERVQSICKEADTNVILTYKYDLDFADHIDLETFDYSFNQDCVSNVSDPNDLCYIIFTSGSTGKPKGVKIRHRNLVNYCYKSESNQMIKALCGISDQPSIICVNNYCFDAFIDESILPLLNGFKIFLTNQDESIEYTAFKKIIKANEIDIISTTPTKLKMLTQNDKVPFKHILLGGEKVTREYIADLENRTSAKIFNTYGPTEITVGCTYGLIEDKMSIDIGRPIANTEIYILDKYLNPLPVGAAGELCVAGDGVGEGYLNRPELTEEKFIKNPFGKGKLYKTGDVARWNENGSIEYVGRNDDQVKIRGLRIELGEIESVMSSIDGITEVIVVVPTDETGRQYIVAYYTGKKVDSQIIRTTLARKLPKYMIPHVYCHMEKFPINSSGKIQRQALPKVDFSNIELHTGYVAPQNEAQRELCNLIESVLKIPQVGIEDDFFDIGGDSLRAIEFVSKARAHGFYFSAQKVFDYRTVKGLTEYIVSGNEEIAHIDKERVAKAQKLVSQNGVFESDKTSCSIGNILLTGATGFLGSHILADYLKKDTGTAYCIVRGKDINDSQNRLAETLSYYFPNDDLPLERTIVLCGNLQEDVFGINTDEYKDLTSNVNTVINAAANVKHYGSYEYFYEANVETVKRIIDFCKVSNAKLIHVSTTSVSGEKLVDNAFSTPIVFDERSIYINQSLENVYVRSKFEAELCVLEAIIDGLQANIVRVGNLTNRSSDGVFQKNYESNAFLKRIRAIMKLKMWPQNLKELSIDFTPIDDTASAILTIVRRFDPNKIVFHMINHNKIQMSDVCEMFTKHGHQIDIVNNSIFEEKIQMYMEDDFSEILEAFVNDMGEDKRLLFDNSIIINSNYTSEYLRSLGFEWSKIDEKYLKKYINYVSNIIT